MSSADPHNPVRVPVLVRRARWWLYAFDALPTILGAVLLALALELQLPALAGLAVGLLGALVAYHRWQTRRAWLRGVQQTADQLIGTMVKVSKPQCEACGYCRACDEVHALEDEPVGRGLPH